MKKFDKKLAFGLMLILILLILVGVYYLMSRSKHESNYELQLKCSQFATAYFEDLKSEKVGLVQSSYKSHYNTKLDICILSAQFEWNQGYHINVYNAVERKQLMWMTNLSSLNECLYSEYSGFSNQKCDYDSFNKKLEKYLSE